MEKLKAYIYSQLADKELSVSEARELLKELKTKDEDRQVDQSKDIAVIGMAGRFGDAEDLDTFWGALKNGKDFIGELPNSRQENVTEYLEFVNLSRDDVIIRQGAYLEDIDQFEPEFFNISPGEAALMDPNQRLFLEVVVQAIEDAGYGGDGLVGTNTGLFVGFSHDFGDRYKNLIKLYAPAKLTMATLGNINSVITGRISHLLDLHGPAMLVDTACSSALVAVHQACMSIRNGESDLAIAGGVKLWPIPAEPKDLGEFGGDSNPGIGIESKDGRCHSFDESASGAGFGEGAGAILLKPLKKALEDRDPIYAVIKGTALNQDGRSIGISAPNLEAQNQVIQKACRDAHVEPHTINYIEAHGTGTKLGDPIEVQAISNALKQSDLKSFCGIGSVKSNVGHLDHAAGIVGLIKLILALKNKEIPPSIHFHVPNPNIDFFNSPVFVVDRLTPWRESATPRRGGISSFGLSGTNCHMILEEPPQSNRESLADDSSYLFPLSAMKEESLEKLVKKYIDFLEINPEVSLSDLCYTASVGRGQYQSRLAIIVKDIEELLTKLRIISLKGLTCNWDGILYGKNDLRNGKTAMIAKQNLLANITDRKLAKDRQVLKKVAESFVEGNQIAFIQLYQNRKYQRIHLPSYIFTRKKCWVSKERKNGGVLNNTIKVEIDQAGDYKLNILIKEKHGEVNDRERKLAEIWGKVMELEEISIYDNFYDLGGDSIIGMTILMEIQKEFNVELPMEKIFNNPTISAISEIIPHYQSSKGIKFTKVKRRQVNR